jgi:hypothetical protein
MNEVREVKRHLSSGGEFAFGSKECPLTGYTVEVSSHKFTVYRLS